MTTLAETDLLVLSFSGTFLIFALIILLIMFRAKDIPQKSTIVLVMVLSAALIGVLGLAIGAASSNLIQGDVLSTLFGLAVGVFGTKGVESLLNKDK